MREREDDDAAQQAPGANRRWPFQFRRRGSRHESAVAQLSTLGHIRTTTNYNTMKHTNLITIDHSTMRYIIPILFVAATLLAGCHSPSQVHTQKVAPTVAAPPPFHPMLITVFGTHPSPDGSWKIGVSEDAIHFARPASGEVSFTPDSHGWRAQAGWFVFIESKSRVWAYDGNHQIYLEAKTAHGGALYYGVFRATNFDSNFPCAVPPEVISHLPEQKQKEIQPHG